MTRTQRNDGLTYREQDAIQDVIKELNDQIDELRLEIASLTRGNETLHKLIHEQLTEIAHLKAGGCARNQGSTQFCAEAVQLQEQMRHMVRLDDPVLVELVGWMTYAAEHRKSCEWWNAQPCDCGYSKALSAYEARVKSIWPTLQNHGHMDIDYKYNNETTTMSPARVKEVGK